MSQSVSIVHKKPNIQTCLKDANVSTCVGAMAEKARQITWVYTLINDNSHSSKTNNFESFIQWFVFIKTIVKDSADYMELLNLGVELSPVNRVEIFFLQVERSAKH